VTGTAGVTAVGIIDTHVHVVSDDAARYPRQINASATHRWWAGVACDTAALLRTMDAHGVAAALAVQAVGVYGYDNTYLLDEVASGSRPVAAVAAVDVDAGGAAEEITRLSAVAGVVGVRLFAVSPGSSWVHTGKADAAFDAATRSGLPVVLTVFEQQLPPLAPSIARYPTLPIALDHCAFPTLDGARIHRGSPLLELAAAPNVTVKVSSHVLLQVTPPAAPSALIDDLLSGFGPDRVMWGSDWPQTPLPDYGAHVQLARRATAHLEQDVRLGVMGRNAAVWLGERFVNSLGGALHPAAPGKGGEP
jgi:predicted TIM-barrel fold metal-dependent hydrolase